MTNENKVVGVSYIYNFVQDVKVLSDLYNNYAITVRKIKAQLNVSSENIDNDLISGNIEMIDVEVLKTYQDFIDKILFYVRRTWQVFKALNYTLTLLKEKESNLLKAYKKSILEDNTFKGSDVDSYCSLLEMAICSKIIGEVLDNNADLIRQITNN